MEGAAKKSFLPDPIPRRNIKGYNFVNFSGRASADKNFLYKLGIEVLTDQVITLAVNIQVRGNLQFWDNTTSGLVAVQCVSALLNDVSLVTFLAPIAGTNPDIPSHAFQRGKYLISARIKCWIHKGILYALLGSFTAGASYRASLVFRHIDAFNWNELRENMTLGAISLGISSNSRYQILNGIEQLIAHSACWARLLILLIRLTNNVIGAYLWILLSKICHKFNFL